MPQTSFSSPSQSQQQWEKQRFFKCYHKDYANVFRSEFLKRWRRQMTPLALAKVLCRLLINVNFSSMHINIMRWLTWRNSKRLSNPLLLRRQNWWSTWEKSKKSLGGMALFDTASMTSREIGQIVPGRTMDGLRVSFPRFKSMVEIFSDEDVQNLQLSNDL